MLTSADAFATRMAIASWRQSRIGIVDRVGGTDRDIAVTVAPQTGVEASSRSIPAASLRLGFTAANADSGINGVPVRLVTVETPTSRGNRAAGQELLVRGNRRWPLPPPR